MRAGGTARRSVPDNMHIMRRNVCKAIAVIPLILLAGCKMERTEYHRRPAFHHQAAIGDLPDEVVLEDGTRIVYRTSNPREKRAESSGKKFQIREENEDGTITLRAMIPEHVLANLIECLHNEEYDLIYHKLLSQHTRDAWESQGNTEADFAEFFANNRSEIVRGMNRVYLGLSSFETIMEHLDNGVIEVRLRGSATRGLKFTRTRVITEGAGLKLLTVR